MERATNKTIKTKQNKEQLKIVRSKVVDTLLNVLSLEKEGAENLKIAQAYVRLAEDILKRLPRVESTSSEQEYLLKKMYERVLSKGEEGVTANELRNYMKEDYSLTEILQMRNLIKKKVVVKEGAKNETLWIAVKFL